MGVRAIPYIQKIKVKIKMTKDVSSESTQVRREWSNIFKIVKRKKKLSPRILYPVKVFFKNKDKNKGFFRNTKLEDFITSRLMLQVMLREVLQAEEK